MFWLIAVITFILIGLLYGSHVYLFDKRYRLPPGPMPLPFIGSFYSVLEDKPFWKAADDLGKKYGPVVTFYAGQVRMVFISGPKTVRDILVNQSDSYSSRMDTKLPGFQNIPEALTSANGDVWRQRRRFAMRAMRDFGMGKEAMVGHIQEEVVQLLPEISSHDGRPFNPRRLIANAVSNITSCFVFGKRFNYDNPKFTELLQAVEKIFEYSAKSNLPFFLFPPLKYVTRPSSGIAYVGLIETLSKMLSVAIDDAKKDFSPENIRHFPDLYIQALGKEDALDFNGFRMTMLDMFLAGTETTSTAILWTLAYLGTYPEIQARCHATIDSVIDTSRLPSTKDRPNLVYIDAVMCEVLRLGSILPTSLEHSNSEEATKMYDYDIPPYTLVVYNIAALHRDPAYWKDPEVFNPDRWISPDGKLLTHSSHFMPFGIGPRICLGESLARALYFLFIVSMLHRFRFSLKEPIDFSFEKDALVRSPQAFEIIAHPR